MIRKQYYNPKNRAEWLVLRSKLSDMGMVGGSDISTILHANPWRSAIELFYTNVGFTPRSDMLNEKMIWGIELEDKIMNMYQYYDSETHSVIENYERGLKVNQVRRVNAIVTNDKYPYLFANIDRFLPDINGIGEAKNMSGFVLDSYEKDNTYLLFANCPTGLPPGYYAQLQQYMMVYEKKRGRFIFNRDGCQLVVYDIVEDEYLQEKIAEASLDFGTRVETGRKIMSQQPDEHYRIRLLTAIEPIITDQETYNQFRTQQLLQRDLEKSENTMVGTQEMLDAGRRYISAGLSVKEYSDVQTLAGNEIKTFMFANGVDTLTFGDLGKIGFKKRLSVKLNG